MARSVRPAGLLLRTFLPFRLYQTNDRLQLVHAFGVAHTNTSGLNRSSGALQHVEASRATHHANGLLATGDDACGDV